MYLFQKLKDIKAFKVRLGDPIGTRVWKKIIFLTSVGRNAIIVIVAGVIAKCLDDNQPFTITGKNIPISY